MVGDYIAQSDWMATRKTREHGPAAAHALAYTACFLPITRNPKALVLIGGTHFVIDRYRLARHVVWAKNQVAPADYRTPRTSTGYSDATPPWMSTWLLIIVDNTMHACVNRWALKRWS